MQKVRRAVELLTMEEYLAVLNVISVEKQRLEKKMNDVDKNTVETTIECRKFYLHLINAADKIFHISPARP